MTRSELARQAAARTGLGLGQADAAIVGSLASLAAALARGETVRLAGFGTFAATERPVRTGRNPRTGAPLAVPASRAVRFRPARALRDAVNPGRG